MLRGMGDIYLLTFPNGKRYVGRTSRTAAARFANHKQSAKKSNRAMYQEWRANGVPRVDVLHTAPLDELPQLERLAVARLGTLYPAGYNSLKGGYVPPEPEIPVPEEEPWVAYEKYKARRDDDPWATSEAPFAREDDDS